MVRRRVQSTLYIESLHKNGSQTTYVPLSAVAMMLQVYMDEKNCVWWEAYRVSGMESYFRGDCCVTSVSYKSHIRWNGLTLEVRRRAWPTFCVWKVVLIIEWSGGVSCWEHGQRRYKCMWNWIHTWGGMMLCNKCEVEALH